MALTGRTALRTFRVPAATWTELDMLADALGLKSRTEAMLLAVRLAARMQFDPQHFVLLDKPRELVARVASEVMGQRPGRRVPEAKSPIPATVAKDNRNGRHSPKGR